MISAAIERCEWDALFHLPAPVAGADADGPLAGELALPLNGGAPGPVVIDPFTAAGMPFELGILFPPAVVRGTPVAPPVPSLPAVRSSLRSLLRSVLRSVLRSLLRSHPAVSIKVHAINTALQILELESFIQGSPWIGLGVTIQVDGAQIDAIVPSAGMSVRAPSDTGTDRRLNFWVARHSGTTDQNNKLCLDNASNHTAYPASLGCNPSRALSSGLCTNGSSSRSWNKRT